MGSDDDVDEEDEDGGMAVASVAVDASCTLLLVMTPAPLMSVTSLLRIFGEFGSQTSMRIVWPLVSWRFSSRDVAISSMASLPSPPPPTLLH